MAVQKQPCNAVVLERKTTISRVVALQKWCNAVVLERKIFHNFKSGCFTKMALTSKYAVPKNSLLRVSGAIKKNWGSKTGKYEAVSQ